MKKSKIRFGIDNTLHEIEQSEEYRGQIFHRQVFPAKKAMHADLKKPLPDILSDNLNTIGIRKLFTHQVEAINHVRDGRDVVVVTETASGKSLCYHLPVLETILNNSKAKAIYLFPTKALAQDQSRALAKLIDPEYEYDETKYCHVVKFGGGNAVFGTYDGDTPKEIRPNLRRYANVILTNPDMLSLGILPNHSRFWSQFFSGLKYIVIDEIHVYRGVFGSHVSNVMRRLERICERHGARPQFICCSATTANPDEHAAMLLNREPAVVTASGAPSSKKHFVMWNPPILDRSAGMRKSSISESIKLFSHFVSRGFRTIVFARARPTVEVILKYTRDLLREKPVVSKGITSYRGGYMPEDRRQIEQALSKGELLGVTCTNALELGVDIGSLDVAVINGYPGSIASTWQQAGRAGRRGRESLAVFVATDEPLDQYLMRNPEYFFGASVEHAIINPYNPYIQSMHLRAAAHEIPLSPAEEPLFGANFKKHVRELITAGQLTRSGSRAICPTGDFPAQEINLRTSTAERFSILLPDGAQIGMMDAGTVFQYLHDGAVYMHQGESYLVEKLDLIGKFATVTRRTLPYYTRALSSEDVRIDRETSRKKLRNTPVFFGFVNVSSRVHSFKKIRLSNNEVVERVPLDFPEEILWTQSLWFHISRATWNVVKDKGLDFLGGLHAVEHASIGMLPFLAMCDRDDIGGLSISVHPDTNEPTIFIHDGHPGGIGLSEMGYHAIDDLLEKTLDLISGCPCEDGCPSCIQSPKCGNMNEPLDKKAAVIILKSILKK